MSHYAIVINNAVTNMIVADDLKTALAVSPNGATVVEFQLSDRVDTTWTYDGTKLVAPIVGESNA